MTDKAKRIGVGILGGLVLFAGIAMLILPGPAFIVIPTGLAILSTQFEWARKWKDKAMEWMHEKRKQFGARRKQHS